MIDAQRIAEISACYRVHPSNRQFQDPDVIALCDYALAAMDMEPRLAEFLAMIYPEAVFTGESGDPGAVAVVQLRAHLASLRAARGAE